MKGATVMENNEIGKLFNQYVDKFHECVPIFLMPQMTDEEMAKTLLDCIKSGKPYDPGELDPEADY